MKRVFVLVVTALSAPALLGGCTTQGKSRPEVTQRRAVDAELANQNIGEPSVKDFLATCDVMARDLVMCAVVQNAKLPVVVEVKPVENKTGRAMDLTIYPQTIRGMILKQGPNRIAFRDETARKDIIAERTNQSDDPVNVTQDSTYSKTTVQNTVGGVGTPIAVARNDQDTTTINKTTSVLGKIADTDYFLNGFIYAANETQAGVTARGFRYYRFQFRLTDARSGIVVWENDYEVKKAGALASPPKP